MLNYKKKKRSVSFQSSADISIFFMSRVYFHCIFLKTEVTTSTLKCYIPQLKQNRDKISIDNYDCYIFCTTRPNTHDNFSSLSLFIQKQHQHTKLSNMTFFITHACMAVSKQQRPELASMTQIHIQKDDKGNTQKERSESKK